MLRLPSCARSAGVVRADEADGVEGWPGHRGDTDEPSEAGVTYSHAVWRALQLAHGGPVSSHLTRRRLHVRQPCRDL